MLFPSFSYLLSLVTELFFYISILLLHPETASFWSVTIPTPFHFENGNEAAACIFFQLFGVRLVLVSGFIGRMVLGVREGQHHPSLCRMSIMNTFTSTSKS